MTSKQTARTPNNCFQCKGNNSFIPLITSFDLFEHEDHGHSLCRKCGITFDSDVNEYIDLKLDTAEIRKINDRETYRKIFVETSNIGDDDGNVYTDFEWLNNQELKSGVAKHAIQEINKQFPEKQDIQILDLGCGTGFTSIEMANQFGGKNIVAVDPSPEIEKINGYQDILAMRGTLDSLHFKSDSFDVIVIMGNLMLHNNPTETLKEAYRILKNDGILIIDFKNVNSFVRRFIKFLARVRLVRFIPSSITQRAFVNMRFGFHKKYIKTLTSRIGFTLINQYSKPPRLLEFDNQADLQKGFKGKIWRITDLLDKILDERAWVQMTLVKTTKRE